MNLNTKITMKKPPTMIVGFALVLIISLVAQQPSGKGSGTHLGTWQLISSKYGDAKDFSDFPKEQRRVKLITATHFTWVQYDAANKKVESMAGGPYTLDGESYTETIEFVGEGMETYRGKKQPFTIKVDGDKLNQSGQLSDGLKIEEVWQRLK
jgi:hypothetical protein